MGYTDAISLSLWIEVKVIIHYVELEYSIEIRKGYVHSLATSPKMPMVQFRLTFSYPLDKHKQLCVSCALCLV